MWDSEESETGITLRGKWIVFHERDFDLDFIDMQGKSVRGPTTKDVE